MSISDKNYIVEAGNQSKFCCYGSDPCDVHCRHEFGTYDGGRITAEGLPWKLEVCGTCGAGRSKLGEPWQPAP